MKKDIMKYWWAILLMLFAPVMVNSILSMSTPFKVYENQWLGFWGSYLGALFPFIILVITINNSRKENDRNRKTQAAVIEYQVSKEYLASLKKALAQYLNALHVFELGSIPFGYKESKDFYVQRLHDIGKEVSLSFNLLELELVDYEDPEEQTFKLFLNKFNLEFNGLLGDIGWFIDHKVEVSEEVALQTFHNLVIKEDAVYNDKKRIWKIIEENDYSIQNDGCVILNSLLDTFGFKEIYTKANEFIKYEKTTINIRMKNMLGDYKQNSK